MVRTWLIVTFPRRARRATSTEADPNPGNNDLAAIVRRYLGIKMDKIHTKLGGSDWSRTDLSPAHYAYMAEDVSHLPALWSVLEKELRETQLDQVFRERMKFFPHLNQIKMTGNPIDSALRDGDYKSVTAEKEAIREELRTMFVDYRHPIPKSRLKTVKVQVEWKIQTGPWTSEEEFSPSNRDHVLVPWLIADPARKYPEIPSRSINRNPAAS